MPAKSKSKHETAPSCRICGGEVNRRGQCAVCGTKQSEALAGGREQNGLAAWLKGDASSASLERWIGAPIPGSPSGATAQALRKWLSGEEGAFEEWLGSSQDQAGAAKESSVSQKAAEDGTRELRAKALEVDGLRAELDAMRATLAKELANFRSGRFDPVKYIEETANLSKRLQTEIAKRKELEQEIEHIKKGSIAVIKYVKAQQLKAGPSGEAKRRLEHETAARRRMEAEASQLREMNERLRKEIDAGLAKMNPDERVLKRRELKLAEREAALQAQEATLAQAAASDLSGAAGEELKQRLEEELRTMEQDYLQKEEDLKKRIIFLEEEVGKYKIEEQLRAEAQALEGKSKPQVQDALAKKQKDLLAKEKSILIREQEIQRLHEELQMKDDELKKLKEPLTYKEEELLRREEDLLYREKLMQAERRKLEEAKALGGSMEELNLKQRLEELKGQITQKEEEVRTKEKYLQHKMEELRLREQGLIEEDIDAREQERQIEFRQEKVKTGIPRLDDLLFGGIPFGSNVSIYGPAYVGKEVVADLFVAEGLRKGLPAIWVLTDKGPADIREEMTFVLPGYEEYEKLGLVRYVDAYSKSMGTETNEPNTSYINEPTDYQSILKAVDETASEFKKKHRTYRLCFRSVSTLIAYLDHTTTFRFLQPLVGRRKRDKAVSMYVIEKGMHGEQEIQLLGSLMDGAIEFKVEQLKSFLSVKGVCDVQSRGWIRYSYTKGGVSIGSFSLDHIK